MSGGEMAEWSTVTSDVVYENPWIRVRHDAVVRPDGSDGVYGVVETQNLAVFIVAIKEDAAADGQDGGPLVLLETVNRYTVGMSVEVPAGAADGQDPLVAAQRELLEETGYEAAHWTDLGHIHALNGVAVAPQRVFLARDLRRIADAAGTQRDEGISAVEWVRWTDVLAMITDGRITDGETVTAVALAALHLGRLH
jgi:8-oxo-dGTP pyrophosphatase MutT (NUDIX family)